MSGKKTLIWTVVLLVLAAFYYIYEIQGEQKKRQEEASKRELLFHLAADNVTGFTVKREQETVRAKQRDGHWYLTEPLTVRGDDQKYRELMRYVADLHHTRVVEEQPQSLEPYGLATPRLEIQVTLKDQTKPLILRLGATNPTGGSYYAQVEGRSPIYLVGGVAKDVLDASLHALRDKTVLAFTPAEVQEIQLARGTDAPVVVQRQAEDTWRLTAPVSAKADNQQVRAMIQRLHDVKVQAFIAEDTTDLESYGLQTLAWHVSLNIGQDHTPLTFSLGKVDSERKGVYAKRGDAARVFLLPQELWDNLPKTATALRDKTLMKYEREHVTRLEIQAPHEHIVITNTGPRQYTMEQPLQHLAMAMLSTVCSGTFKTSKPKTLSPKRPMRSISMVLTCHADASPCGKRPLRPRRPRSTHCCSGPKHRTGRASTPDSGRPSYLSRRQYRSPAYYE